MSPQRTFGQLLQLGDGFDSREAGAGEDEREAPLGALGIGVGELDPAQHVVAQADRVADVLERRARAPQAGTGGVRVTEPSAITSRS